jgi:hypothetical protein
MSEIPDTQLIAINRSRMQRFAKIRAISKFVIAKAVPLLHGKEGR